jgi:hypothetical protein
VAHPPRPPGWQRRLQALVVARLAEPFAWGSNDCLAFVADAVQAMHDGRDVLAESRQARSTPRQAHRAVRQAGGLLAGLARAGLEPVAPSHAVLGDVVLVRPAGRRRERLALCNGPDALAPGPDGLEVIPMADAVMAWRH